MGASVDGRVSRFADPRSDRTWALLAILGLSLCPVLLALVVGSACDGYTPPGWESISGEKVAVSSGRSDATPIEFYVAVDGDSQGRPGERRDRGFGTHLSSGDPSELTKVVYTWTPPPEAYDIEFMGPSDYTVDPGGPPFVIRNVPSRVDARVWYKLPPYPAGDTRQQLTETWQASYNGGTSTVLWTTYMPDKASFGLSVAAEETPAAPADTATTTQVWYTSAWYTFDESLTQQTCQAISDLLTSGRMFVAMRVPLVAPPGGGSGTLPIAMRGTIGPWFFLQPRPPTVTWLALPAQIHPQRQSFLTQSFPPTAGEQWLALGTMTGSRMSCQGGGFPAAAGKWQINTRVNFDLGPEPRTIPTYVCYEGNGKPLEEAALAFVAAEATASGLQPVRGDGITCFGPMPITLGDLSVNGGAAPMIVPASTAAQTIQLPHNVRYLPGGSLDVTMGLTSSLSGISWKMYPANVGSSGCNPPDLAHEIVPGVTRVTVPGGSTGTCVWSVATLPGGTGFPQGPHNLVMTATSVGAPALSAWGSDILYLGQWTAPPPRRGPSTYVVPALAHAPGTGSAQWRSDVAVVNPLTVPVSLSLTLYDYDTGTASTRTRTLPARSTEQWKDVLVSVFGASATGKKKGTLRIDTNGPLAITARTYNQASPTLTYGQYYPALTLADTLPQAELGVLPALKKTSAFRTNVGVVNLGAFACDAVITLHDEHGTHVGNPKTLRVPAGRWVQQDDIFAAAGVATLPLAYATVAATTAGARIWAYASVIDNATGDPTTVSMLRKPTTLSYTVPAVAHAPGVGSAQWRTDVAVVNMGTAAATLDVTFHNVTGAQSSITLGLQPGAAEDWSDVLVSQLRFATTDKVKGSLHIASTQPLVITSRTYNQETATRTYGQTYPALTLAGALVPGQQGYLPHLTSNASSRTNLGIVTLGHISSSVAVKLFKADGTQVGSTRTLTAGTDAWVQQDNIFGAAGAGNQNVAYATVEVTTTDGRVWAYASVIDNGSNDPTTIPVLPR